MGTIIDLDACADISLATAHRIVAKPPGGSGAPVNLLTAIEGTTTLRHIKTASTLHEAGPWELQVYVELEGGTYHGEIIVLRIHAPIA